MIKVGSRVLVYDSANYLNDKKTPYHTLMKPATVVRKYDKYGYLEGCIDVKFDDNPEKISKGHFVFGVILLEG